MAALGSLTSLWAVCLTIVAVSLTWLSVMEIDEYERRAYKPKVGRV